MPSAGAAARVCWKTGFLQFALEGCWFFLVLPAVSSFYIVFASPAARRQQSGGWRCRERSLLVTAPCSTYSMCNQSHRFDCNTAQGMQSSAAETGRDLTSPSTSPSDLEGFSELFPRRGAESPVRLCGEGRRAACRVGGTLRPARSC